VAGVASGCCGSGLGTGTGLAGAPSADSGLPLATGTHDRQLRHGFSDFSRLYRSVLLPPTLCSSLIGWKWPERWGAGVVICLERGADLHTAQQMPLPLTVSCFSKIQIGLSFWYQLTRVVLEKGR